jgi:hypothetical protein
VVRYRFLDGMGDVVAEHEFDDHRSALAFARGDLEPDSDSTTDSDDTDTDFEPDEVQRVEYLGPEGDWRWAGALEG